MHNTYYFRICVSLNFAMWWRFADNGAKCDLFDGDWIPDKTEPFYTNSTCEFIEQHQNCMKNGRPDRDYLYWRWKPRGCDLPRLDPWKFLDLMRNKSWALIGDSISRNHVQSLLCMLSVVKFRFKLVLHLCSLTYIVLSLLCSMLFCFVVGEFKIWLNSTCWLMD